MKVSLNWLTDYVDISVSAEQLAQMLTQAGLEVESEFEETDSDLVLDIEITSNRADCLGHIGLAREIASVLRTDLKEPEINPTASGSDIASQTKVTVADAKLCPRYTARLIKGVKIGPSPSWLVERLEAVGLRSVNNVVDVTNYILLEYSQPLHAFDFDKLSGPEIIVRYAKAGETITAIDGSKCELKEWMGVIADSEKPVAIAGVMGGLDSEVSDDTVNILLESASFDPLTIRRGSRELGLLSESSYRFERGVDVVALDIASQKACQMIMELAGGELAAGVLDEWASPYKSPVVELRPERCNMLLGVEVPQDRQIEILNILGLKPKLDDGKIVCTIPSHRSDLTREVDLIEEVGRIYGFDKLPIGHSVTHRITSHAPVEAARKEISSVLTACGYYEAITTSFIEQDEAKLLGFENSLAVDPRLRKANGVLRQEILPSLLRCRKLNQDAGNTNVNFFEISAVFPPAEDGNADQLPQEYTQLALLSDGSLQQLRGAIEAVIKRFDPQAELIATAADNKLFAAGSAAKLQLKNSGGCVDFGYMGIVDAKIRDYYALAADTASAMLHFECLLDLGKAERRYQPVPRFPSIKRDLSIVVDEALSWADISETVAASSGELLNDTEFVGIYRGKQVGSGKKSVTMRLEFRHNERTLTHEEVDASIEKTVAALASKHSAVLRS